MTKLPLPDAAELGTPRTDARLYNELMLIRLPTGASEIDIDERAVSRAGSGSPLYWVVSMLVGSAASLAKSRDEYGVDVVWSGADFGQSPSPPRALERLNSSRFRSGGAMETSAPSVRASMSPGAISLSIWDDSADDKGFREWEEWASARCIPAIAPAAEEGSVAFSAISCGGDSVNVASSWFVSGESRPMFGSIPLASYKLLRAGVGQVRNSL
jgi:hypothetical protein